MTRVDTVVDLLEITRSHRLDSAVWNIAVLFAIYILIEFTQMENAFVKGVLPMKTCTVRLTLSLWTKFGELSENIYKLGHIAVEALYIIEYLHANQVFTVGTPKPVSKPSAVEHRRRLTYIKADDNAGTFVGRAPGIADIDCGNDMIEPLLPGWVTV